MPVQTSRDKFNKRRDNQKGRKTKKKTEKKKGKAHRK
jgi:hypothetical protein